MAKPGGAGGVVYPASVRKPVLLPPPLRKQGRVGEGWLLVRIGRNPFRSRKGEALRITFDLKPYPLPPFGHPAPRPGPHFQCGRSGPCTACRVSNGPAPRGERGKAVRGSLSLPSSAPSPRA